MHLKRKLLVMSIFLLGLLFSLPALVSAEANNQEPPIVIDFFWREGCSHCAAEKPFLQALAAQYPQIELNAYEVYNSSDNRDFFYAYGEAMGFETNGVPVTIIGDQFWVGFSDEKSVEMEDAVKNCLSNGCPDTAVKLVVDNSKAVTSLEVPSDEEGQSSSPAIWIVAAVVVVIASYGVGRILGKQKEQSKSGRKRH